MYFDQMLLQAKSFRKDKNHFKKLSHQIRILLRFITSTKQQS